MCFFVVRVSQIGVSAIVDSSSANRFCLPSAGGAAAAFLMWATRALQALRVCSGSTGTAMSVTFATVLDCDIFASGATRRCRRSSCTGFGGTRFFLDRFAISQEILAYPDVSFSAGHLIGLHFSAHPCYLPKAVSGYSNEWQALGSGGAGGFPAQAWVCYCSISVTFVVKALRIMLLILESHNIPLIISTAWIPIHLLSMTHF